MFSPNGLKRRWILLGLCTALSLTVVRAVAQSPSSTPSDVIVEEATTAPQTAPVVFDGVTLFHVTGVSAFPAEKRAEAIADRIQAVAADRAYAPEVLRLKDEPIGTRILAGSESIMLVTDADASLESVSRPLLAQTCLIRIGEAVTEFRREREPNLLIRHGVYALAATLALIFCLWVTRRIVRRVRSVLERRYKAKIHGVQIASFHLIHAEQVWRLLSGALSLVWAAAVLVAAYVTLHYVLSIFPWTRGLSSSLLAVLMNPLISIGAAFLNAVPNLIFLAILVLVTWYALKLIRLFFVGIEKEAITLSGFDAAWAKPTYRLVRGAVIAFALVAAYPYIPGSESQAFKGVSLLFGVVFSLGSTSLIGNMISGYSMTYRRLFKPGDRVKIGDHVGNVEETKLMVTYLRTPKNELIAVPNSVIINAEVVNYSTLERHDGLILHTTVGISYETPWRQVDAMLIRAAERTPGLLREPKPFVLLKELREFAVTYEINAYCREARAMGWLYTLLHANILDVFNEYGVQIMTPAYEGDPEQPKIVPKDQWYSAPASPSDNEKARA
ncbi:MAG: mechanosensitive ion channel domain-containing protein [Terriglobales bacterium]|jgi:small-conductance mechanosensitive channel